MNIYKEIVISGGVNWEDIENLPESFPADPASLPPAPPPIDWNSLDGKPDVFPPDPLLLPDTSWDGIADKPLVFPPDPDLIPDGDYIVPHTWIVPGDVAVPSGDANVIPPMFIKAETLEVKFIGIQYKIGAGTSVAFDLHIGGTSRGNYSATTTAGYTTADYTLGSTGDIPILPIVTAVSGSPKNLSVTILLQYTKRSV